MRHPRKPGNARRRRQGLHEAVPPTWGFWYPSPMETLHRLHATTGRGLEELLARELEGLGARAPEIGHAVVTFTGDLELAYRACLWSRTASRVLLELAVVEASSPEALRENVRALPWGEHLSPDGTLAVTYTEAGSPITHTNYGAQLVKDGVVDRLRDETGRRPSVDRDAPDLRLAVHAGPARAILSVDLAGRSLHRRTWRIGTGPAPVKETLAAGLALLADWPTVAAQGGGLVDPMCGTGTLLIEAALLATDTAPGLLWAGEEPGGWQGHDGTLWRRLLGEARERDRRSGARTPPMVGYDRDRAMIRLALGHVEAAGLTGRIHVERRELGDALPPPGPPGLVLVNPPYGERLGEADELGPLYAKLGDVLKRGFPGWTAWILTGSPELGKQLGLRVTRRHPLWNGPMECRALRLPLRTAEEDAAAAAVRAPRRPLEGGAEMLANRLRKNLAKLGRWTDREDVRCYRIYDRDLPEYALTVDWYDGWAHVQEYPRPADLPGEVAEARLEEARRALSRALEIPRREIFVKRRERQRGADRYRKRGDLGELRPVREGGLELLVNPTDYFDAGLFLDHRPLRARLRSEAGGRRFLNLFCYTGAASVAAAAGGAARTTSVDLSNTYLDWARRNLERNGFTGPRHELVRADCLRWVREARGSWEL
ncbi:MAG: bifunctional 23S rRNA (guanine(2069)-N(7))-methyltransferase RlmK/23S rRNA (guanine(2445)-N(2))-methyltransferase RlmL, partial [Deltaproteobacteria bacterium]|nr:bifunctional 23S rRNA (guanine(2069)-N(7))-methyltransferase RlmK/23S rRNA (guanine(2445)-N(2))-methyltransferase RlmL [Deltaproteobacteria bacterium]